MGRTFAMWLAVSAVACSQAGGEARVTVHLPPTATPIASVAMFVGVGPPDMKAIAPEGFVHAAAVSTVWQHDGTNDFADADVASGKVVFAIRPGAAPIGAVIVVALDASTPPQPVAAGYIDDGLIVNSDQVTEYTLTLETAGSILQQTTAPLKVEIWGPPDGSASCVWVAAPDRGLSDMIVTAGDADCDGLFGSADQCDPRTYLAMTGPPIDNALCVATRPSTPNYFCELAGQACSDATGFSGGTCEYGKYCVPFSDCSVCTAAAGTASLACLKDMQGTLPTTVAYGHISCQLYIDPNGQACSEPQNVVMPAELAPYICKRDPQLWDPTGMMWGNHAQLGTMTVQMGMVTNCAFQIMVQLAGAPTQLSTIVAGDLTSGRGFAIPITFEIANVGSCPPADCTYAADPTDVLMACLTSPPGT
jgi:hypothetical protein